MEDPIYISPTTPFYTTQPRELLRAVYASESARLASALGPAGILMGPAHIGSSAIAGMPGTPVVDIAVQLASFPPSDEVIGALANNGYTYKGASPHDEADHWCMGGTGKPGHLGRTVVHLSKPGSNFYGDAVAYVEFCNSDEGKESRSAYAEVKLEGLRLAVEKQQEQEQEQESERSNSGSPRHDSAHVHYKIHKHKVVSQVLEKAKQWNLTRNATRGTRTEKLDKLDNWSSRQNASTALSARDCT